MARHIQSKRTDLSVHQPIRTTDHFSSRHFAHMALLASIGPWRRTPTSSSSMTDGSDTDLGSSSTTAMEPRSSIDPPEEMVELPLRASAFQYSFPNHIVPSRALRNSNNIFNDYADDDNYLDEFELEGLVMTANSCSRSPPSLSSSFGAGGGGGGDGSSRKRPCNCLIRHCSPLMALCSVAWNPHNRSRSAIALFFVAFLCMAILTRNDILEWHRSFFSRTKQKQKTMKLDPFSQLTADQRESLLKSIYGTYTFYDGSAEDRPKEPYMTEANAGNPYLDLPAEKFPPESWQADAVYANHFLDASEKLVKRAMQAIFATYHGHGLSDVHVVHDDNGGEDRVEYVMEDADIRTSRRSKMFYLEEVDLRTVTTINELEAAAPSWDKKGGWTTQRSFDGLKRRLIHAMMTNSNFTVVITGSWQSMGYGGNHDWQSMAGVFETLLKGLFEKLGVNLVVRAIGLPPLLGLSLDEETELAKGGRSTLIHSLGWSSIYGSDVDMVVWDDYSTVEGIGKSSHDLDQFGAQLFDLFARQALLSGSTTLPFLWGGDFAVLRNLHEHADVDVGQLGNALLGVPESSNRKVLHDLPWATQYLNCPESMQSTCEDEMYLFESRCWIEQPDFAPPTPQLEHIPILPTAIGWRMHQLKGYTLAYIVLAATLDALFDWSDITISQGFPLADEYWHMGEYIENVKTKVVSLNETTAPHCFQLEGIVNLPKRLCTQQMKGRTEFTPRADPFLTNIRSIIDSSQVPKMPQLLIDQYNVENPIRTIPKGEVDAMEIFDLQGKRRLLYKLRMKRKNTVLNGVGDDYINDNLNLQFRRRSVAIAPGIGWRLLNSFGDDCDGSLAFTMACGRLPTSTCLLDGHQGSRGGIWGNETTGWLVLNGIRTENGYIALNLEIGDRNKSRQELFDSLPDSFVIEYSVDGIVTSLDKSVFEPSKQSVPGMTLVNVLNDETMIKAKDVTVAVQVKGCADNTVCQIALTHVYWS
jgi:hypothetical protein